MYVGTTSSTVFGSIASSGDPAGSARNHYRCEKTNLAGGERWVAGALTAVLDLGHAKGTGTSSRRLPTRCSVRTTSSRSVHLRGRQLEVRPTVPGSVSMRAIASPTSSTRPAVVGCGRRHQRQ